MLYVSQKRAHRAHRADRMHRGHRHIIAMTLKKQICHTPYYHHYIAMTLKKETSNKCKELTYADFVIQLTSFNIAMTLKKETSYKGKELISRSLK